MRHWAHRQQLLTSGGMGKIHRKQHLQAMRIFTAIITFAVATSMPSTSSVASAQDIFGPTEYLQATDLPDGFCEECQLEDFEDNQVDSFLAFDCGEILGPNVVDPRIPGVQITDSVDGDDGTVDGNGNGGHSYFCVDPATSVTVRFDGPVAAAGGVWTDGDRGVSIQIEAFDINGNSLAISEPEQVADASYFGETAEDRFLGVRSNAGISSITIRTLGSGAGIEIDHVRWDSAELVAMPEPPTLDEVCSAISATSDNLRFDLNADGVISPDDVAFMLSEQGTIAGDLNLDRKIGFDDFLTLSGAFGQSGVGYGGGDVDCNGSVAFADFLTLSGQFGFDASTDGGEMAVVPEAAGYIPFAMAALALALRFRRKR